ncbi:MAG: DUF1476 domain-containing protein [Hansschlegelia sp.]
MLETRERAEEARFAHRQDLAFRTHARRDRVFGRWAAHLMGLRGQAVEDYARRLVMADVAGTDDELLAVVRGDLIDCGVSGVKASEDRLRRKLERLQAIFHAQLEARS